MIIGYFILSISAIVLIYLIVRFAFVFHFRKKNKNLSNKELNDLKQDLYWDLDDFGWDWRKAIEYRKALKMLKERGV
jgi:hypothetical protein